MIARGNPVINQSISYFVTHKAAQQNTANRTNI